MPFADTLSWFFCFIKDLIGGRELVVTKHGKMTVALVAASQLYRYREMERVLNEFLAALDHDISDSDTNLALAALKKRAAAKREDFEAFMNKVPHGPPLQGDEIQK